MDNRATVIVSEEGSSGATKPEPVAEPADPSTPSVVGWLNASGVEQMLEAERILDQAKQEASRLIAQAKFTLKQQSADLARKAQAEAEKQLGERVLEIRNANMEQQRRLVAELSKVIREVWLEVFESSPALEQLESAAARAISRRQEPVTVVCHPSERPANDSRLAGLASAIREDPGQPRGTMLLLTQWGEFPISVASLSGRQEQAKGGSDGAS